MFIGKHDDTAQYHEPYHCNFGRVRAENEPQGPSQARAGYRMPADASVRSKPADTLFNAIVDLMQRVAQVFLRIRDFILYCGIVYHYRLISPMQV